MLLLQSSPIYSSTSQLVQEQRGSLWLSLHEDLSIEVAEDKQVLSSAKPCHGDVAGYRADSATYLQI